ncbi:cell division-specific peptidoglycan biosynthesis regulator FtsW [Pseudonocardia thermophila]|jgi:cell division protein FtsW|uniref:Probable peptidoglycan glycosyltransferase FtsW n=1 Tax=Pseudonocardia thermophila TaxID=1848 RepID=A0A1M6VVT5_PSETH|nr:putative lipid II flippase FtsW [Pseudonocardia thermophila]SHK85570.1 cell division-specific peptidoglycan biosynthesis regulator FtsW [Pseudonocardia thermophila]
MTAAPPAAREGVRKARYGIGRALLAVQQWLRRPLTSLHLVLGIFAILTLVGLVMVLSASSVEAYTVNGSSYSVFVKQLAFCVPGLALFWLGLRVPPRTLRSWAPALLVISVLLLVAVLVVGVERNGSKAWFGFGSFTFQPSEGAKVALTLWGAHVLAARRAVMHRWKYALSPVVPVTVVILTLLVLQPDLGMTISMGIVLIALLFYAGAPKRLLAVLIAGATVGALALAFSASYRLARITAFFSDDTEEALRSRYQINQSLYSLADGGLFGVGLGQGRAKYYLPQAHNDFIFAVIGGELGFVGAFCVVALYALLAYTGFRIAARNTDPWLKLVVATCTTWLVAQAAINICYVVGLLPVTGLQLPLISSGGTSLIVTMFVFGVLANAARHEPEAIAALRQQDGGRYTGRLTRLLRLPAPQPYKAPPTRQAARPTTRRQAPRPPAQRTSSRR